MAISLESLLSRAEEKEAAARAANIARQQRIETIFDEIIGRFRPGGAYGAGMEAQIARGKTRDVAAGMQQLVSSGLYGTTLAAGLPKKWEEEVGMPARQKLEDIRMERLSEAQMGKAGFLERIQEPYPDYAPFMQAAAGAGQVAGYGGGIAGGRTVTRTMEQGPSPWEAGFMGGGWSLGPQSWEQRGYGAMPSGITPGVGGTPPTEPRIPYGGIEAGGPRMDIDFGGKGTTTGYTGAKPQSYSKWLTPKGAGWGMKTIGASEAVKKKLYLKYLEEFKTKHPEYVKYVGGSQVPSSSGTPTGTYGRTSLGY